MSHRAVLGGMTLLAACACGAGAGLASVATSLGAPIPSGWPYAALLATGGWLLLRGLGRSPARVFAGLAVAALLVAGLLAPPRVMSDSFSHSAIHLGGFMLYLVAAALFVVTFLRYFQRPADPALVAVLGSVALAAGCTCCLTPGAIRYSLLFTGWIPSPIVSRFALVAVAVAVGVAGFAAVRAWRPAAMFLAGVAVVYPIEKVVELAVPTWQVGGASLTFLLRYPVWLIGTGMILYAAGLLLASPELGVSRRQHHPAAAVVS